MFLFFIPVCVVLVSWKWEKRSISCLHFYIGGLEMKIDFFFVFMSVLYWYPGNGK
jgi:hypothetical protein